MISNNIQNYQVYAVYAKMNMTSTRVVCPIYTVILYIVVLLLFFSIIIMNFFIQVIYIQMYYIQSMKYRKILIKYNAYLKKAVYHSRENIKSCTITAVKI